VVAVAVAEGNADVDVENGGGRKTRLTLHWLDLTMPSQHLDGPRL